MCRQKRHLGKQQQLCDAFLSSGSMSTELQVRFWWRGTVNPFCTGGKVLSSCMHSAPVSHCSKEGAHGAGSVVVTATTAAAYLGQWLRLWLRLR